MPAASNFLPSIWVAFACRTVVFQQPAEVDPDQMKASGRVKMLTKTNG
jgi:hypothetical protein